MQSLSIRQPDDWHIHLRDGDALPETCRSVSRVFKRAIIMPNLKPAVLNTHQALEYRERILSALPDNSDFEPLMTLYLTENTSVQDIKEAATNPYIHACKLYPSGATTNSDSGVRDIHNILPVLEAMQESQLPLLVHGEVTHQHSDIFDREKIFIDEVFAPLTQKFPELRMVFEHITTLDAVQFVEQASENIAATITAHHLLYNRNDMLAGGIRPHYYCLPVLKRNIHQQALLEAACSNNPKFFLGTDSAPHAQSAKETACGCAGIYSAPAAIELYAHVFEQENALDKLEAFASVFGPNFYKLPLNENKITLVKKPWQMPENFMLGSESIIPICAGETLQWQIENLG